MFENLAVFENRLEELNLKLYDPTVAADRDLYRALMKEHKEITPIVETYRALKKAAPGGLCLWCAGLEIAKDSPMEDYRKMQFTAPMPAWCGNTEDE